jgi:hypothetical protein
VVVNFRSNPCWLLFRCLETVRCASLLVRRLCPPLFCYLVTVENTNLYECRTTEGRNGTRKSSIFRDIMTRTLLKMNRRFGELRAGFLLSLFFDPDDGRYIFLWNIGWSSTDYTVLYQIFKKAIVMCCSGLLNIALCIYTLWGIIVWWFVNEELERICKEAAVV